MNNKTLSELFSKYTPTGDSRDFMESALSYKVARGNGKANINQYEITVELDHLIPKRVIFETEDRLCAAYENEYKVRFKVHYPTELFSLDYMPEVIHEAERVGAVVRGFFVEGKYDCFESVDGITVAVPFPDGAERLMNLGDTAGILHSIIYREFDKNIRIIIQEKESYVRYDQTEEYRRFMDEESRRYADAATNYESAQARKGSFQEDKSENAVPESEQLPRLWSLFDPDAIAISEDGTCTIGKTRFDISSPQYIMGDAFKITPVSISTIRHPLKGVVVIGTLVTLTSEESRQKGKFKLTGGIFDGNASIPLKWPLLTVDPDNGIDELSEITGSIKQGQVLAVYGNVRKNDFDGDLELSPKAFAEIKKEMRKDRAPKKRVELHLHTMMSAMDAVIAPDVAVKTAQKWGHSAVAITDHGNVQGFPEAMIASEKLGMKVIYGMEAYFVNNTASPLTGKYKGKFSDPMVVFDLETTGLSADNNRIIEIGAVKIQNGEVIDRFGKFVNPKVEIPAEITELTSITNEMVADADPIEKVLPEFMEFIGKLPLIAHNASFDAGFVRVAASRLGIPFENPYLDTVALSRYLNPELKNHKLDSIAEHYNLGDFNHHRAVDDAEMLAMIFFAMANRMNEDGIFDFDRLNDEIATKSDPLALPSYHMIILVKNLQGLENLYRLISASYLAYYRRHPRIPKSELDKYREGLIIGSACESGELYRAILDHKPEAEIDDIASYYDYLEIQPNGNNMFLVTEGKVADEKQLCDINRKIVAIGKKLGKPVCATSDAHFVDPDDEIYRRILLAGMKFRDADKPCPIYFHTTDEMLDEFSYLGEKDAYDVVVENTNLVADMIDDGVRPIPEGTYTPNLEGAVEELQNNCWSRAHAIYGDELPDVVKNRLETELNSIISNGFAVLYVIAARLVAYSESQGYLVGSRGSVGSSFAASMAGISEVNPLPPHYYCPKCRYSDFSNPEGYGSGFDMPDRDCPVCGTHLMQDGQDIPFETFLGFKGDKSPDIDLNFSGEVQGRVHKFTEELFGKENVFRAGTLGTLADKTAFGFVSKYFEGKGVSLNKAEKDRIIAGCVGVKRTTGQHPGGIIVVPREYSVYKFTPIQHPADDPHSNIVTTHFAFSYLHDTILKLDELGHDIPTKYKMLEKFSGVSIFDVKMNDKSVYELFYSTEPLGIPQRSLDDHDTQLYGLKVGTLAIPEMGTNFIQQVLVDAKPRTFADLMQISGLTHGTDVWLGNAQELIKQGICDISQVVGTRDGIMLDLIRYGVDKLLSFKIMEFVRKGRASKDPETWKSFAEKMREASVPEWYIESCRKIKYMFQKAHAAAYVMSSIRLGWYKVHQPVAFYCAILSVAPSGFDAEIVGRGLRGVEDAMHEIDNKGKEATANEKEKLVSLQLAHEAMLRGIRFLQVDIERSHATEFLPENGNIRMPFTSLPGLGDSVALKIQEEREITPFFSVDDLRDRAKVNKGIIDLMKKNGVLDNLSESDQISIFDKLFG